MFLLDLSDDDDQLWLKQGVGKGFFDKLRRVSEEFHFTLNLKFQQISQLKTTESALRFGLFDMFAKEAEPLLIPCRWQNLVKFRSPKISWSF